MYILGINPGHDATAVLLKDHTVIASVAEERMTRVKYHFGFPYESIKECLRIGGIAPTDIDRVVFGGNALLSGKASYSHHLMVNHSGVYDVSNELPLSWVLRKVIFKIKQQFIKPVSCGDLFAGALRRIGIDAPISSYDHHLCHAASAYFNFGYDESLIITADGAGDGLSSIVTIAKNGRFENVHIVEEDHSVGAFYSAITKYLGFKRNRHEGKVTGLAAYGNPEVLKNSFSKMIYSVEEGKSYESQIINSMPAWKRKLKKTLLFFSGKPGFVNEIYMAFLREQCNGSKKEDIAAACQTVSEEVFVNYAKYWVNKCKIYRVGLAGGIFSNVRINQKIMEIPEVEEIFIHPNMGDGGIAMGAALLYYNDHLISKGSFLSPSFIDDVFYGSEFDDEAIEKAISNPDYEYYRPENFASEVARLVFEGNIVGHFNNRMEYGPRALGARTILANATNNEINNWLNKRLKRTEFMPFAPVCPEELADKVFENYSKGKYPAKFMTITFDVKDEWKDKIPAVVHVDGTARPQTITSAQHKVYYDIVKEYCSISGLPALINTSFNVHEEPIVRTPREALNSLKKDCIDLLAIGSFIVKKRK